MKTRISKVGTTTIIAMDGTLDFETQEPFQRNLSSLIERSRTDSVATQIVFDFENLEFVGSSGISAFVQSLKDFSAKSTSKPKFCNVGSEFKRVMRALDSGENFEFLEDSLAPTPRKVYDN